MMYFGEKTFIDTFFPDWEKLPESTEQKGQVKTIYIDKLEGKKEVPVPKFLMEAMKKVLRHR